MRNYYLQLQSHRQVRKLKHNLKEFVISRRGFFFIHLHLLTSLSLIVSYCFSKKIACTTFFRTLNVENQLVQFRYCDVIFERPNMFPFQIYKRSFIDEKLWAVLTENLGKLLRKEFDERSEDDRMIIERILILVRNILQVRSSKCHMFVSRVHQ